MRISLVAISMVSAILAENILDVEALDEAKTMEGLDQGLNETLFGEEALDEIRTAEYLVKSLKDQQAYFDSKLDWNSSDVYSRDAEPATTVEAMVEVADKPTDVIQKTKDISANISTVRSGGTSCDVNGWDGNQFCLCPNGQRISHFESHHNNHHEDRRWYLKCAVGPEYQIPNKRDWYTAQQANGYDGVLRWDGTSTNSFLVGMKSHHNNHHEDRQYTLFTATANKWKLNQCSGWKQLNTYDHRMIYVLATNEVIAAVYSHHSDHREDREFAIKVCFLSACTAFGTMKLDWDKATNVEKKGVFAGRNILDNTENTLDSSIFTEIGSSESKSLAESYKFSRTSGSEVEASLSVTAGYEWGNAITGKGSVSATVGFSTTWSTSKTWERSKTSEITEANNHQTRFTGNCGAGCFCRMEVKMSQAVADIPYIITAKYPETGQTCAPEYGILKVTRTWNGHSKVTSSCDVEHSCDPGKNIWECCSPSKPCPEGEGDCDNDSDCNGNLVCGKDNCRKWNSKSDPSMDCCKQPVSAPSVWNGQCVVDSGKRVLPYYGGKTNNRTPGNCIALCRGKNYKFAGVQHRDECWCGNTAPKSTTSAAECNRPCPGDSSKTCGASWRMNVYSSTG